MLGLRTKTFEAWYFVNSAVKLQQSDRHRIPQNILILTDTHKTLSICDLSPKWQNLAFFQSKIRDLKNCGFNCLKHTTALLYVS